MPEIDFVSQNVDVKEFPDILLALICIESFVVGELISDLGDLHLYSPGL